MQLGLLSSAVQGHRVQAIAKPQKHPYFRTTLVTCIAEPSAATSPQPVSKCPVAQASSFFANATSSILGRAGPSNANAHTWLEGGLSGQDVPGRLVSGLRPLHDIQGEFIVVTDTTYVDELTLKAKAFATRRDQVFVAESDSLAAQQETLDMVVDALIELGRLKQTGHDTLELKVDDHGTTWTFCTSDYTAAPLELAARLVQEDLVLMRPPSATPAGIAKDSGGDDATSDMQPPRYCMTAAAVVFSFGELEAKLGAPMPLIHAPVPGFEKDLDRLLSKTFDKLRVDKPVWRNNWGLAPDGILDEPLYGFGGGLSKQVPVEARWLKTEYQTLRRLPQTNAILFTVRTFVEPLTSVPPEARRVLAESVRGMSSAMLAYKGISNAGKGGGEDEAAQLLDVLGTM